MERLSFFIRTKKWVTELCEEPPFLSANIISQELAEGIFLPICTAE
jgi:hypothetical protein